MFILSRRLLLAAAAFLTLGGTAMAADLENTLYLDTGSGGSSSNCAPIWRRRMSPRSRS